MRVLFFIVLLAAGCHNAGPVDFGDTDADSESESDSELQCHRMCGSECYNGVYCEYHH
jgi:hypothetical protein